MDQNKTREVVLGRISHALKSSGKDSNPKGKNQNYDNLYVCGKEDKVNLFLEAASNLGVQLIRCSGVEEFKIHFQKIVAMNKWEKLNCVDASLYKALQLDTVSVDWTDDMIDCHVAITSCEVIVARTGTIVMDSSQIFGRVLPIHTPVHIIIGYENQVVYDLRAAFERIQSKSQERYPSALFFSSGVSSTGDIEKTLVRGVHGPREVIVYLFK